MAREDLPGPDNKPVFWFQQLQTYSGATWPSNQPGSFSMAPRSGLYTCPSYVHAMRGTGLGATNSALLILGGGYGYNNRGVTHKPGALLGLGGNDLNLNYASYPPFSYQY